MKKILLALPVVVLLLGFYSGKLIDDRAKTLLQTMKLSEADAKSTIFSDISSTSFYLPGIKELKSIALNERVSQVEIIGKYAKEYTLTDDFKKRYNEYRELQKPSPPEEPQTMAEMKKQQKEELEKAISEMKVSKSQAPADQKAMYDDIIKVYEDQLKEIENPDNPMYSAEMDNVMQENYQQQLKQHESEIAAWEAKYPKDNPKPFVKVWLQTFLEQSNDVDFSAKTAIDEKGKTLFVKQEYERKDNFWKLCFRAGKETTESARNFAQMWLKEL